MSATRHENLLATLISCIQPDRAPAVKLSTRLTAEQDRQVHMAARHSSLNAVFTLTTSSILKLDDCGFRVALHCVAGLNDKPL